MRYDKPIYFQRIIPGAYDPDTGNYADDEITETKVFANVTETGVETLKLIYGDLTQGSVTIKLLQHYEKPFDRIRIGHRFYSVDFQKKHPTKHYLVCHEVQ